MTVSVKTVRTAKSRPSKDKSERSDLPCHIVNDNKRVISRLRPSPYVSGYFRIRNFFFPDTATVHTYQADSTANPKKVNPLSRVEKNISLTNPITCGRVNWDIFESDDVKSMSSLSPNNKPIWQLTWKHVSGEQSKFTTTISLYGACSEDILVQRSLGYCCTTIVISTSHLHLRYSHLIIRVIIISAPAHNAYINLWTNIIKDATLNVKCNGQQY